jgi:NTP pyrophosphatase (non-canonical NTP hydrolase)
LAMIHSEVSEVLEAIRKEKGDHIIAEEFADILIRVFDLYEGMHDAGYMLPRLGDAVENKMHVNNGRARMHGVLA